MPEFVRVRTENGMEATLSESYAKSVGAEIIDADATNVRGEPLAASRRDGRPPKRRTSVKKEAAKKTATKKAASSPASSSESNSGSAADQPEEASK